MTQAEIDQAKAAWLAAGNKIKVIPSGVSGLPDGRGKLTRREVRERIKNGSRRCQVDACCRDQVDKSAGA